MTVGYPIGVVGFRVGVGPFPEVDVPGSGVEPPSVVGLGVGGGVYSEQKGSDRFTCGISVLELWTYLRSPGMQPSRPVLFIRSVSMLLLSLPREAGIFPLILFPDKSRKTRLVRFPPE